MDSIFGLAVNALLNLTIARVVEVVLSVSEAGIMAIADTVGNGHVHRLPIPTTRDHPLDQWSHPTYYVRSTGLHSSTCLSKGHERFLP